ncbi:MAG: glutaredoxin family protein [Bacillota bacterium]
MSKVDIYTSDTCHYCHLAKDFLDKNNVDYTEHSVTKDIEARKILMKKGVMSVPYIVIDGDEIQGFDEDFLKQKLNV